MLECVESGEKWTLSGCVLLLRTGGEIFSVPFNIPTLSGPPEQRLDLANTTHKGL